MTSFRILTVPQFTTICHQCHHETKNQSPSLTNFHMATSELCVRNTEVESTVVSVFLDLAVLLNMRNGFAKFVFAYFTALSLSKL
jgi:hypothetical protein